MSKWKKKRLEEKFVQSKKYFFGFFFEKFVFRSYHQESEHIYEELHPNSQMRTLDVRLDAHRKYWRRKSCDFEQSFDMAEKVNEENREVDPIIDEHEEASLDIGDVIEKVKHYRKKLAARMSSLVTV